ncbi:flagellar M-ring protein FliF [Gammaproteobacteria bacterium]
MATAELPIAENSSPVPMSPNGISSEGFGSGTSLSAEAISTDLASVDEEVGGALEEISDDVLEEENTELVPQTRLGELASRLPPPVARFLLKFAELPQTHQVSLMVAVAAAIALGVAAILWARAEPPAYQTLFGGLPEADIAQIVEALQKHKMTYQIDPNNGSLMVPASEVHTTRIKLAGLGLPKTPPVGGFEILDNQQPFGTSQFMEGARYQRALEGELAHSISTLDGVQSARVHLAIPRPSVFVRDREKPSASVVIQLRPSRYLERGQVEAIVHLVASSIPQLETNRVSVVDQNGELLTRQDNVTRSMDLTTAQFEHVRRVEDSYVKRIEHILTPLTGPEGVRAQVNVEMDFNDTEQTREIYNPDQPALRSEQTIEEQTRNPNEMGIPGALSNQPPAAGTVPEKLNNGGTPPAAGQGITAKAGNDSDQSTRKRHATRNYEVDRTISHSRSQIGQTRRVSAAVIVDDALRFTNPPQRVSRSPEEMERIRALVREAVGYDAQRGDAISVVNLSFAPGFGNEIKIELPWWKQPWAIDLLRKGLAALLILILIFGVLRPVYRRLSAEEKPVESEDEMGSTEGEEGFEEGMEGELERDGEISEEGAEEIIEGGESGGELTGPSEGEEGGEGQEGEDDDVRELRPNEGEEDEEEVGEDGESIEDLEDEGEEAPLARKKKKRNRIEPPEVPDYESYLDHIRYLMQEEPKMISDLLKEWINGDEPPPGGKPPRK